MSRPDLLAISVNVPMNCSPKLSEIDQGRLVHAIETALDVHSNNQFHAWMYGPFCDLLPHESLVCLEIGGHGTVRQVDFLHHGLVEAETIDFLCNPAHGLAIHLTRLFRAKTRMSYVVDAALLESLLKSPTTVRWSGSSPLFNAVIHRARFISGATYLFILFNVPQDQVQCSPYLFKLLSSHLKLALSRVINTKEMNSHVSLTDREAEIVRWMAGNKTTREMSEVLGISPITVKNHINKLFRKLDVQNRADAVSRGLAILDAMHNDKRN